MVLALKNILNIHMASINFICCDKEKYKDNMNYFPPLIFKQNELNYIFELNYKGLFIEKDDKYILLVFFDDSNMKWYLGKPFLKKNYFVINQEAKTIGFYRNITNDYNPDKKKSSDKSFFKSTSFKIIVIIIQIIILLVSVIIIGKYYFGEKKKPLNVMEDECDYSTNNNEIFYSPNVELNNNKN